MFVGRLDGLKRVCGSVRGLKACLWGKSVFVGRLDGLKRVCGSVRGLKACLWVG